MLRPLYSMKNPLVSLGMEDVWTLQQPKLGSEEEIFALSEIYQQSYNP